MSADSIYLIKLIIIFVDNSQADGKYLPIYYISFNTKHYHIVHLRHNCLMISFLTKIYISAVRKLQWIYF